MTLLQDDKGNVSSIRFGFFFSLLVAAFLSIYIIIKKQVSMNEVILITSWLATAFGGKSFQKFAENKQ